MMKSLFKKVILGIVFAISCGMFGVAEAQHAAQPKTFKLVVFGDSLSAGYRLPQNQSFASQLQSQLYKLGYLNVNVINHSRSGETTGGGLKRLPAILKKEKPNGLILELGINDVFRGYSVTEAENNLSKMIELCQKNDVSVLLVGMQAPPYASIIYQQKFGKMYETLAQKYNLLLYPFFMKGLIAMENGSVQSKGDYMLGDKIHPNTNGVSLMVKNIMPYVAEFLKENKILPKRYR